MSSAAGKVGRCFNSGLGSCPISPLVNKNGGAGSCGGRWWELEQGWDRSAGAGAGQLGTPEEALLEGGETARLADEDISYLAHLDADEEHGVTGVLLVQALPERLQPEGSRNSLSWDGDGL